MFADTARTINTKVYLGSYETSVRWPFAKIVNS